MSPKGRNHLVFLEDILEAIAKIGRYTQGLSLETFRENDMVVDAVIRILRSSERRSDTFPTMSKRGIRMSSGKRLLVSETS